MKNQTMPIDSSLNQSIALSQTWKIIETKCIEESSQSIEGICQSIDVIQVLKNWWAETYCSIQSFLP